jgi:hypothetical protein
MNGKKIGIRRGNRRDNEAIRLSEHWGMKNPAASSGVSEEMIFYHEWTRMKNPYSCSFAVKFFSKKDAASGGELNPEDD